MPLYYALWKFLTFREKARDCGLLQATQYSYDAQ